MSPKDANMLAEMKLQKCRTERLQILTTNGTNRRIGRKDQRRSSFFAPTPPGGHAIQVSLRFLCPWYPNMLQVPVVNHHISVTASPHYPLAPHNKRAGHFCLDFWVPDCCRLPALQLNWTSVPKSALFDSLVVTHSLDRDTSCLLELH